MGLQILKEKFKLFYILFLTFFMFFIVHHYHTYTVLKGIIIIFLIMIALIFVVCFKYQIDIKQNLHKMYFFVGSLFGIMYLIMLPVYCVPDEQMHYWATYHISNELMGIDDSDTLLMRADDANMLLKVEYFTEEEWNQYLTSGIKNIRVSDDSLVDSENEYIVSISYCYYVAALGLTLGRLLGLGSVYAFWLGRFFNLILFVFGMSYAIKKAPIAKMGFFAMGLFPVVLQEAASFSHDMLINLLSVILISVFLDFYGKEPEERNMKEMILYGILLALLIPLKGYSYFLFILFPLIIAFKDYRQEKRIDKKILIPVGGAVLYNLILVVYRHLGIAKSVNVSSGGIFGEHMIEWCNEPGYTVHMFIENPVLLLRIIYKTVNEYLGDYFLNAIGHQLGWLNIGIPQYLTLTWMILAILMFMKRKEEINFIGKKLKIVFAIMSVCVFGIILMGLLLAWTPAVYDFIVGVQGRYFLPILPLVFLIARTDKIEISEKYDKNLIDFTLFISAMVVFTVYARF